MPWIGWMGMFPLIKNGKQTDWFNTESCFLVNFFFGNFKWGLAHICPSAGDGPFAIDAFPNHEDFPITEYNATYIHFWSLVALLAGKEVFNFLMGSFCKLLHDLNADLTQLLITIDVVLVPGKGKPGLRYGLQALDEGKPVIWMRRVQGSKGSKSSKSLKGSKGSKSSKSSKFKGGFKVPRRGPTDKVNGF